MRLRWTKHVRRWLGGFLALVMIAGILVEYVPRMPQVRAASEEPVYDAATGELKYSEAVLNVPKGSKDLGVTFSENETYYVSFKVKGEKDFYFDYRGSGRLLIAPTQYCVLGVNGRQDWVQENLGLETGVAVTIAVMPDKVSVWLNGKKAVENALTEESRK